MTNRDKAEKSERKMRPESLMMTYGYRPELSEGSLKCPIFQTSTFAFKKALEGKQFFATAMGKAGAPEGQSPGLIYSRLNNPDLEVLEDRLCLWDGAEACVVFNSGMAAISTTLLELLRPGDVMLHSKPVYGGTDYLINSNLRRNGIKTGGFPAGDGAQGLEAALAPCGESANLALIYVETPANPTNELVDIEACVQFAQKHSTPDRQVLVVVDNTFLGPLWQHPLKQGADLVIYSATKFIGGHSDLIAGVCLGSRALVDRVRGLRTLLGTMPSPWTGWLLMRSLETLKLRMTCQMKNARHVANFLADHPKVEKVYYLGNLTEDDAAFAVYRRQCLAPGSMISFDIVGGEKEAFQLLDSLKLITLAVSLGGTESLAEHPATMTHSEIEPDEQLSMGITSSMIRLSIGVENPDDLISDLEQALEQV